MYKYRQKIEIIMVRGEKPTLKEVQLMVHVEFPF